MKDEKTLLKFTCMTAECSWGGVDLKQTVWEISRKKNISEKLKNFCIEIYEGLSQGKQFSAVLKKCTSVKVPDWYFNFMVVAEECGCLKETLDFAGQELREREKNRTTMAESAVYPLFIVLLTFALAGVLTKCFPSAVSPEKTCFLLTRAALVLTAFSAVFIWLFRKLIKTDSLLFVLKSLGFFSEKGADVKTALDCSLCFCRKDKKIEKALMEIKKDFSEGRSLCDCFYEGLKKAGRIKTAQLLSEKIFVNELSGKNTAFVEAGQQLSLERSRRMKLFFVLQQPLFMVMAGIIILLLLKDNLSLIFLGNSFNF